MSPDCCIMINGSLSILGSDGAEFQVKPCRLNYRRPLPKRVNFEMERPTFRALVRQ
jgi:hypothetical protein